MRRLTPAVLLLTLTITMLAAVPAEARPDPVHLALEHVMSGSYTAAELDLLRRLPMAGQIPDPTQPAESGISIRHNKVQSVLTTPWICGEIADVWYRKKSLLGSTIYIWHHVVTYCRDGVRVRRWQSRYDYLSQSQGMVYVRERTADQHGGIGTRAAWSMMQRHLEYCVARYGCYANTYAWARITVYGNGGYNFTGSAS